MKRFYDCLKVKNNLFFSIFLAIGMVACGGEKKEEPITAEEEVSAVEERASETEEWDYENTNWEKISECECRSNVQSPVNIETKEVMEAELAEIDYEYPFPHGNCG